jgi:lysophosphatidic acid phosphatase type 6
MRSGTSSEGHSYNAGSIPYVFRENFRIHKVVVIHRHGDRSQIARSLGPAFAEETADLTSHWELRMPSSETKRRMSQAFRTPAIASSTDTTLSLEEKIYSGEDEFARPYAQLTELGAKQLMNLGAQLRKRYALPRRTDTKEEPLISPHYDDAANHIYLRSTNTCRTLQSLKCLVAGLYDMRIPTDADMQIEPLLSVSTRPKSVETLHAQPTAEFLARKALLLNQKFFHEAFPGWYSEFELRMRDVLGYKDEVNWLVIKEVLTCHKVHDYPFTPGLTLNDEVDATRLCAWIWGRMYRDVTLNRMAIGSFVRELLDDILLSSAKMLIYSAHDSSLVPILCALGIYNDTWPPYASYLTLEFGEQNGELFVRTLYNDEEMTLFTQDHVLCPLHSFEKHLQIFVDNEEEENLE